MVDKETPPLSENEIRLNVLNSHLRLLSLSFTALEEMASEEPSEVPVKYTELTKLVDLCETELSTLEGEPSLENLAVASLAVRRTELDAFKKTHPL